MSRPFAALASATLVSALACGSAAAVDAVAGTQLVMHLGPGAEHRTIATVPAETRLTVHGCNEAEGWCLVRFEGRHGWVEGGSLNVVGFSRRPEDAARAAVQPVVAVPEPVAPPVPHYGFVTADDVIVGVGERFGLAAIGGRPGDKALDRGKRHRGGLAFKRHGVERKGLARSHGRFKQAHLDRRGFHFAKSFQSRRAGLRQHGHFASRDKPFRFHRTGFGKPGHFARQGKGFHPDLHGGKRRSGWHIARHGKPFGHSGKAGFGGFRLKGGWKP